MICEHEGQDKNFAVILTGKTTSTAHYGHFVLYFSGVIVFQRGHCTEPADIGAFNLTSQFLH